MGRKRTAEAAVDENLQGTIATQDNGQPADREPGDETEARKPNGYIHNLRQKRERAENGPRGSLTVMLDSKGQKARVLRQEANTQKGYPAEMWIQFNQDPGKEFTSQLEEMGFRQEKNAESDFAKGAYILDLKKGLEGSGVKHAENTFYDIVNQIRHKHGELDPFVPGAGQERF